MADPEAPGGLDRQLSRIAVLGDPIRRTLYRYVIDQDDPVSRDQAATATGVAHHVAKFHLDRLEDEGLLEVDYHRPPGRSGPGAGRPTKFYRATTAEIAISLPQRRYDIAGRVLAQAVVAAQAGAPLEVALAESAFAVGRELGSTSPVGERAGCGLSRVGATLTEYGYQPRTAGGVLTLANCPFQDLARDYQQLACGLNLDLVRGIIDGLGQDGLRSTLNPDHGGCCVVVAQAGAG